MVTLSRWWHRAVSDFDVRDIVMLAISRCWWHNLIFKLQAINEVGHSTGQISSNSVYIPKQEPIRMQNHHSSNQSSSQSSRSWVCPEPQLRPEFTTPLNSRTLVIGYNGTLTCALRGNPRPKITWYKDSRPIEDGSKYRMSWGQGIVQLEIKRATLCDGGTYTCLASNHNGEAAVTTDVFVRNATCILSK